MATKEIRSHIEKLIQQNDSVIVTSGEIHNELKLSNWMPMLCSAMRGLAKEYRHEYMDDLTPSGQTSTLSIWFYSR